MKRERNNINIRILFFFSKGLQFTFRRKTRIHYENKIKYTKII